MRRRSLWTLFKNKKHKKKSSVNEFSFFKKSSFSLFRSFFLFFNLFSLICFLFEGSERGRVLKENSETKFSWCKERRMQTQRQTEKRQGRMRQGVNSWGSQRRNSRWLMMRAIKLPQALFNRHPWVFSRIKGDWKRRERKDALFLSNQREREWDRDRLPDAVLTQEASDGKEWVRRVRGERMTVENTRSVSGDRLLRLIERDRLRESCFFAVYTTFQYFLSWCYTRLKSLVLNESSSISKFSLSHSLQLLHWSTIPFYSLLKLHLDAFLEEIDEDIPMFELTHNKKRMDENSRRGWVDHLGLCYCRGKVNNMRKKNLDSKRENSTMTTPLLFPSFLLGEDNECKVYFLPS